MLYSGKYYFGGYAPSNGNSGQWVWRDDETIPISWTNWKSGQPNKNERACVVIKESNNGEWDDHDCDSHTEDGYICGGKAGGVTMGPFSASKSLLGQ